VEEVGEAELQEGRGSASHCLPPLWDPVLDGSSPPPRTWASTAAGLDQCCEPRPRSRHLDVSGIPRASERWTQTTVCVIYICDNTLDVLIDQQGD